MKSGIYTIINVVSKKFYIGSAVNLDRRLKHHKHLLKSNKHWNKYLQAAWNKYGEDSFKFLVITFIDDREKLIKNEQYYLDKFRCFDRTIGYNLSPTAGSPLGVRHTIKAKENMSKFQKGRIKTLNHIAKIVFALTGKKASDIAKSNISKALTGRKLSEKHIENRKLVQRDFNKWPCLDGSNCKCQKCKDKRADYMRNRRMNKMKGNANG